MMKKLYLSLMAVGIVCSTGVSAQVAVQGVPASAPSAYWLVPMSQPQGYPVVPYVMPSAPAPPAYWTGAPPAYWTHSPFATNEDNLDRLVAAASTFDELRSLLANPARLRLVRHDPLLVAFIRERITAASITDIAGINAPYRTWLAETLLEYGDRLGGTEQIPSFALLPSNAAPSWPAIWRRSFAPHLGAWSNVAVVHPIHGHAHGGASHVHLRNLASTHSRVIARPAAGEEILIIEELGAWRRVQTRSGLTGYILASELSMREYAAAPYHGAESVTNWQRTGAREGYYSPYGWVRPPWTQVQEVSGGR